MKFRYFIKLSYKGTKYHGWQIQKNAVTIQEQLDKALTTIIKEKIQTIGAGRTDTGVHASEFYAHFDSSHSALNKNVKLLNNLNGFLPNDIFVKKIIKVIKGAHSRFDALSRTYEYHCIKIKDPFFRDYSYHFPANPDIIKMNTAAKFLFDYDDFTSFSKANTDVKNNICKIYRAEWIANDNQIIFTIKANRFLHGMVRAIVGSLLDVGLGKISISEFEEIIKKRERSEAGRSAPAHGLFLTNIEYPHYLFC